MRAIDAHALLTAYENAMKELVQATNAENISLEALSLLCGAKLIAEAPTVGGWISVKDKLPDEEEHYLIITRLSPIATLGWFSGNENGWMALDGSFYQAGYVTHWMPLPEGPKEEKPDD